MENKEVNLWIKRISKAKKHWEKYHDLIKTIRDYYTNDNNKNKQNIFWSSIETLKPFIYFKAPQPYIERKDKKGDMVMDEACGILERALVWDMERQDFDGVIKYARNDYLLSGLGLAYEKLEPKFAQIADELGNVAEVVTETASKTIYFDPLDFMCDCFNVKVWEDVDWVAQKIEMVKREVIEQFGNEIADKLIDHTLDYDKELEAKTCIYRIWDKKDRRVLYISEKVDDKFLRVDDDLLGLEGFYPFPKPVFATLANKGMIPTPDYTEIKCLLDELDGVNNRMELTMKALKVSGAYDGSFPELANLLNKDVKLISVADFAKVKENGGIKGLVDFMPIEQYVNALEVLAERRSMLIQAIYEITGVSDIMRGNSDPNETATAVTKKTNFGTLRNQDRQNDFQRFLTELLKIKAELICEQMPAEQLMEFAQSRDINIVMAAIQLLKQEKLRNLTLGIETDTTFMQSEEMAKTTEAVKIINDMVNQAFPAISAQPALLGLYKQMIEAVVATLPSARQFAAAIDESFKRIEADLAQPDQEQPNPDMIKAQAEVQKNQNEMQIKEQQNAIKEQEVQLKKEAEDNKIMMANKEANMQYQLEMAKIEAGREANANITTGYVRGF